MRANLNSLVLNNVNLISQRVYWTSQQQRLQIMLLEVLWLVTVPDLM